MSIYKNRELTIFLSYKNEVIATEFNCIMFTRITRFRLYLVLEKSTQRIILEYFKLHSLTFKHFEHTRFYIRISCSGSKIRFFKA